MNCQECEARLSEYIENELDSATQRQLESHLHTCNSCGELLNLLTGLIETGKSLPVYDPPPWLAARIVANTPVPQHESLRERWSKVWRSLGEPRTALAIFTAAVVLGWIGGSVLEAIFNRAEGAISCAYDHAIRSYYHSPVIMEIHSKIESGIEQFRENS